MTAGPGRRRRRGEAPEQVTVGAAYRKVRKAAKKADAAAADDTVSAEERTRRCTRIRKRAKQLRYTAAALGEDEVADEGQVDPVAARRSSGQRRQSRAPVRRRRCGARGG